MRIFIKIALKLAVDTFFISNRHRNYNHDSNVIIFSLSTFFTPYSSVSIVNFEHVIAGWETKLGGLK